MIAIIFTCAPLIPVYATDQSPLVLVINGNNGTSTSSTGYYPPTWEAVNNLVVAAVRYSPSFKSFYGQMISFTADKRICRLSA